MKRLFDDCAAVVYRTAYDVVLDRNLLPKRRSNGTAYALGNTKQRWILYTDNHKHFQGEYSIYSSKVKALAMADKRATFGG